MTSQALHVPARQHAGFVRDRGYFLPSSCCGPGLGNMGMFESLLSRAHTAKAHPTSEGVRVHRKLEGDALGPKGHPMSYGIMLSM